MGHTTRRQRSKSRIIGFATLAFVSTASVCSTLKAIAVAPPPATRLDSAALTALAVVERVSIRRGLKPHYPGEGVRADRERGERRCFAERSLVVCGEVNSPEVQVTISQVMSIGLSPWADSIRTELLDSLRVEFGASRVRECKWKWDVTAQRHHCPPLARPDST